MKNKLILGTVQFGLPYGINNKTGVPSKAEVFLILDYANSYFNTLDTASAYGSSESRIGEYHASQTKIKYFVNTKFSKGIIKEPIKNLKVSIDKLKIPKIETIMFHSLEDYIKNQKIVIELINKGKGKLFMKFGVSVYTIEELDQLKSFSEVDVIQVSFNLLDNETKKGAILKELKKLGKEIHVRSCFLQGLFFKDTNILKGNLNKAIPYLLILKRISFDAGLSLGNIALSYCLSKPYIDKVLIGVDSLEQLKQNVIWAETKIDKELFKLIDQINVKESQILNPAKW